ncbi:MAG: ABC transporter ATP-binding protein [Candidatus Zixiibacteriota bacterium]
MASKGLIIHDTSVTYYGRGLSMKRMKYIPSKDYRSMESDFMALDGVNFEAEKGQFTAILGPSGCGKTTLLRAIAGLIHPSRALVKGSVIVDSIDITDLEPRKRHIAFLTQSLNLYPHYSVYKNLEFALKMHGVKKAERRQRINTMCDCLDIGHLISKKPLQLSGGERQRVALGKVLIRDDTRIQLYDEPFSNLDTLLRSRFRDLVGDLHRRFPKTTLLVTHDPEEAGILADKILVLNKGRIEQEGTFSEIYNRPDSLVVARLIRGDRINLLQAVASDTMQEVIRGNDFLFQCPLEVLKLAKSSPTSKVTVLIDSNNVALNTESLINTQEYIGGSVASITTLGPETQMQVDCGGNILQFRVRTDQRISIGEPIQLIPGTGALQFFNTATQKRIV